MKSQLIIGEVHVLIVVQTATPHVITLYSIAKYGVAFFCYQFVLTFKIDG